MVTSNFTDLIKPIVRARFNLWAVMTGGVILYVAIAWIVQMNRADPGPASTGLRNIFYGMAVLLAGAAVRWHAVSLRRDTLRRQLLEGAGGGILKRFLDSEEKRNGFEVLSDNERRILGLVADGLRIDMVSLVIIQLIAVLGLGLVVMGARAMAVVPFAVITFVLNVFLIPRPMESLRRARGPENPGE